MREIHLTIDEVRALKLKTQQIIARNLKILRTVKAISQVRMATDLGLTKQQYASYELGDRQPDAEFLYNVSKIYGIRMSALFEENEANFLLATSDSEYYDQDAVLFREQYEKLSAFSRGMLMEYCFQMLERDRLIAVNRATFEMKHKKKK